MSDEIILLGHEGIIYETDEAVLFQFGDADDRDLRIWLPKSKIEHYNSEEVEIPEWLVLEKEIEDYEL